MERVNPYQTLLKAGIFKGMTNGEGQPLPNVAEGQNQLEVWGTESGAKFMWSHMPIASHDDPCQSHGSQSILLWHSIHFGKWFYPSIVHPPGLAPLARAYPSIPQPTVFATVPLARPFHITASRSCNHTPGKGPPPHTSTWISWTWTCRRVSSPCTTFQAILRFWHWNSNLSLLITSVLCSIISNLECIGPLLIQF